MQSYQMVVNMPEDGIPIFTHLIKSRDICLLVGNLFIPVHSSNISHIGFAPLPSDDYGKAFFPDKDEEEPKFGGLLFVLFKTKDGGGNMYRYDDIPRRMHLHLLNAESKVKYLNAVIKGNFKFAKIDPQSIEVLTERGIIHA